MPAHNRPLTQDELAEAMAEYPQTCDAMRASGFGMPSAPPTTSALEVSGQERAATFQAGWDRGDLVSLIGGFTDTLVSAEANEKAAEFIRAKIRGIVDDPETAELLSPRSFPVGAKRPCMDSGYYATFNSDHVHLVDLRKTPQAEITPAGVRTSDAEYEFDGLAVAGFPDLFTVIGPSSPSVLSNMVVSIEQHEDWITDCIVHLRRAGAAAIEATGGAEDEWVSHVEAVGSGPVPAGRLLVHGRERAGKAAGVHGLHRRRGRLPAEMRRDRAE